ncbi:hypothetical protein SIXOD_v1c27550 (plasmid) [Spiroplasma ixodetis Y32]|nr:hypothetical protein SIXOD_v1c27550 [Spiroplasma ixodetis Y32]
MVLSTASSINVIACGGGEIPNPIEKTKLSGLPNNIDVTTIDNDAQIFKIELINNLRKKTFSSLQIKDVDITKNDDSDLKDIDIRNGQIILKIFALSISQNFTGEKTINVNIITTQEKKDINSLIKNLNLGFIDISSDSIPTKKELLIGIQCVNYDASFLTINDFDIKGSIESTKTIIEGKGNYKGEITLIYRKKIDFNIWYFLDHLIIKFMKDRGYWLGSMQTNIKISEILSNNKISFITLNKNYENTEQSELKNETDQYQQLSTQEYDKQTTNTYSVTNKYDIGIQEKIKVPFEETTFNFNFSHSVTNTNTETTTLKYPSQKINVPSHKKINVDYDIFLNNIQSDYILNVKLDKSSTFSGNLYFKSEDNNQGWKTYNFYDILTKLNINKFSNNCLMYVKNKELYYCIPLTLYGKDHELDVTVNSAQPI